MPEEVTFDEASGIARVRAWGVDTIDDWLESRDRVIELYESHGIRRVLVDAREQESGPSTGEIFEFGETWPHEIRVAILSGQRNREDQEFLDELLSEGRVVRQYGLNDKAKDQFQAALSRKGDRVAIVGATSGDTGSAAIEAFDAAGERIV